MELNRFNRENTVTRIYTPKVRIYSKGIISLNQAFVIETKFKAGDTIEIVQDTKNPKDWYLTKNSKPNGFPLRKNATDSGLNMSSRGVCSKIMKSLDKEGDHSIACLISTNPINVEGEDFYAIITKSIYQ